MNNIKIFIHNVYNVHKNEYNYTHCNKHVDKTGNTYKFVNLILPFFDCYMSTTCTYVLHIVYVLLCIMYYSINHG